ncbi:MULTISPECIES: sulfur carrier protein ThiS [Cohnella]|uniref:sulfur carrier protein ThiS n=1 Tax=Cohnella TaxID=329857 RepID=UPI0009BBF701|nr:MULTISPECIES: sulfur carrier protein ThiS [Cohnella]MBN2984569.1 sulfur carrier protein ThiS [Cohnella algarum]
MELVVNGQNRRLEARTILDVIEFYGLAGKPVVVEADGRVLTEGQWADEPVREKMVIEIVHFVGGG